MARLQARTAIPRRDWHRNACLRYRLCSRFERLHQAGLELCVGGYRHAEAAATIDLRPVVLRREAHLPLRIADFDDLLFSSPESQPSVLAGQRSQPEAELRIRMAAEALCSYDRLVVSTATLAQEARRLQPGADIVVAGNDLDPYWISQGRWLYPAWTPGDPLIIRYLAGSTCREDDLGIAMPALMHFLDRHPAARLEVVGQVDLSRWRLADHRVASIPFTSFAQLAALYASSWVTIAPLQDTPFNRCKSAIKFMESAAFGTPCIASPIPEMQDHLGDGVLLAKTHEEWGRHLEGLVEPERRLASAAQLRTWADQDAMAQKGACALVEAAIRWGCRA